MGSGDLQRSAVRDSGAGAVSRAEAVKMKTATIILEESEILALLWAIEEASEHFDPNLEDLHDDAYAVHQRLQKAWQEMRADTISKPLDV